MKSKYYKYETAFSGVKYFKVTGVTADVVQIVYSQKKKVGRAYCIGVTLIKYVTFIANYGRGVEDGRWIKEVPAKEWDKAFNEVLNKLK